MKGQTKSVYIHVPFCSSICSYCDFCKMFYDEKTVDNYLFALEQEISKKYNGDIIETIYIGGGTPSSLSIKELSRLFSIVRRFNISKKYEFTTELNVNDITEEKMLLLKENGVNRISIGVETLNTKHLKFLNRNHTKDSVIKGFNIARKYFDNISIDLMYAFPNEILSELKDDLDFVASLSPEHISIYSLIIEEHTKIYIDKVVPIDEDTESSMYAYIVRYLKEKGYKHYEISNFSKDVFFSKHNLTYWNNEEYYGFGLGASGYVNGCRYTNTKSIKNYCQGKCVLDEEVVSKSTSMENEMIFGLRKIKGVSKKDFFRKYSFNIEQIFDIMYLIDKKLLIDDGEYVFIPEDKLYISNSILISFIGGSNGKK